MPNYRGFARAAILMALALFFNFPAFAADSDVIQRPGNHGGHRMMGESHGQRGHHAESSNLSEEQIQKIDQERQSFRSDSRDIRANIFQKTLEVKAELAKTQPDPKRAVELQKELSNMEAQLDRKYIDHVLRLKVIDPYMVVGPDGMRSRGMGHGSMASSGMGQSGMRCGMMGNGMGKHSQQ